MAMSVMVLFVETCPTGRNHNQHRKVSFISVCTSFWFTKGSHCVLVTLSYPLRGAQVPVPPAGHKWKSVQHDNKVKGGACHVT